MDPQNRYDGDCTATDLANYQCHGGASRVIGAIQSAKAADPNNTLVLDAGDEAMGTIWESYYKSNITLAFQKAAGIHAFTLGNHECDRGIPYLSNLLQSAASGPNAFPVLSANLVDSSGMLSPFLRNSTVVSMGNGLQVGIIGVTTPSTRYTSSCGPDVTFLDPIQTVTQEAARLAAKNVSVIIVLSHLGYEQDEALAAAVPAVDVIVGGHSHYFLYSPTASNPLPQLNVATGETDVPVGAYPTFVPSGNRFGSTPVVQARWAARYLGQLDVTIEDGTGDVIQAVGSPILLGDQNSSSVVAKDPAFEAYLAPLRASLDIYRGTVVGAVGEDLWLNDTRSKETALGDLFCDAFLWYINTQTEVPDLTQYGAVDACIINGGSIRTGVPAGNVTLAQLVALSPFGNNLVVKRVNGSVLKQAITHGLAALPSTSGAFPQVAGLIVAYDLRRDPTTYLTQTWIYDQNGAVDRVLDGLNYTLVTNSYMAAGGDGYDMLVGAETLFEFGPTVTDCLSAYFQSFSTEDAPLDPTVDGRIINCTAPYQLGTFERVLCMNNLSPGDLRTGPWQAGGTWGEAVWTIMAILSLILVAAFVTSPTGMRIYGHGGGSEDIDSARRALKQGPDSSDPEAALGGTGPSSSSAFEERLAVLEMGASSNKVVTAPLAHDDLAGSSMDREVQARPNEPSSPSVRKRGPSGAERILSLSIQAPNNAAADSGPPSRPDGSATVLRSPPAAAAMGDLNAQRSPPGPGPIASGGAAAERFDDIKI